MKNITFTKRLGTMLLLILTCILPSLAVDYGITVGGVKVTSDNKNNITGGGITSGTVTYNPTLKVLTLNNVEINYTSGYGISSNVDSLEIYFTGNTNYIHATFPLNLNATAMVRGSSVNVGLQLDATISPIYVNRDVNLTIKDIFMKTYGGTSSGAIRGYGTNSTLTLSNADIWICADDYPCVKGITDCHMDGVEVASHTGVCYRKSLKGFGTKTELVTGVLKIMRPTEYYNISVFGHRLNDINKQHFCYEGIEGSVVYSTFNQYSQGIYIARQVLYLKDVNGYYDNPDDYFICATDDSPLTINCQGTNTLTSANHTTLYTNSRSPEIWGGGTLNLSGDFTIETYEEKSDFLIGNGSTLNATFIRGAGSGTLSISSSEVNLSGNNVNDDSAISGFNYLTMYGVDFVQPDGGRYSQYVLDADGNKWNGAVKIGEKNYGITVGGVAVTSMNKDNITGSNISGSVRFESNGNDYTLYLEDVTITNRQGYGIGNKSGNPLKIFVSGTCTVEGTHAIYSEDDINIIGDISNTNPRSLTVNGSITGILVSNDKTLTLTLLDVTASGATSSGCIRGGGRSKLVLLYSNLIVDSGSYPCVKGFDECTQGFVEVAYPAKVWYSSSLKGYGNAQGLTTGSLQIKKISADYGIAVAGHLLNDINIQNFYYENVSGSLEYDPSLSVLVLDNLTGDCGGSSRGISILSDKDVILYLEGDNRFYNTYNNKGVEADMKDKGLYIFGEGSLEVDGGMDVFGDLQIVDLEEGRGPVIKATYIRGRGGYDFVVSNSRVYLSGDGISNTICGFRSVDGSNFTFARPINATYSDGCLWNNGQIVTGSVIIGYVDHDTAIDETFQETPATEEATPAYDLLGRRVQKPQKGLYIVGNRKVLVK